MKHILSAREDKRRDSQLRRHSRQLMRQLSPQLPVSVIDLCNMLGVLRKRPIQLVEWDLPADGPFGMMISRDTEDVIVYRSKTTRAHQAHIILHEVGHIVAHDLEGKLTTEVHHRSFYSNRDEKDAEIIASTMMRQAISLSQRTSRYGLDEPWRPSVYNSLVLTDSTT
ncbi:ImmA/IrrE family metallo-endopeptidase [Streptomonospora sediminis]